MAKMYFRYGAMNSGKTSALIQVAYNYEEKGHKIIVIKSSIDTKGNDKIVTRSGLNRKVDILLKPEETLKNYDFKNIKCILVDEAQFLKKHQVDELYEISKTKDIPVICYGLKSDFQTNLFEGSKRILELCDEIEELVTICPCGKKAKLNARKVNGQFTNTGNQIAIDMENNITYESLCGKCYMKYVLKKDIK